MKKQCQREEESPSGYPCGWLRAQEPICETGALLCGIFLFLQKETTAELIKVTMTLLGTRFLTHILHFVSHNLIRIPGH